MQPQKKSRGLNFRMKEVESKNKDLAADLHLSDDRHICACLMIVKG